MKVVILDSEFQSDRPEREVLARLGIEPERHFCREVPDMLEAGKDADAVLVQYARVTETVMKGWKKCRLIVRYGIGYDNIDVEAASRLGIRVCNVPAYCLDEVADHTCALILAAARKILPFHQAVLDHRWDVEAVARPMPRFDQMTVGLVGCGRTGERVLQRLRPFRFRLAVYDPYVRGEVLARYGAAEANSLKELISDSDIVTLHVPLTEETRHLVNRETLGWFKPNAILVNASRGPLVESDALADALRNGAIGGAALDVFEPEPLSSGHPLLSCPNVIFTPHAAYYSDSSLEELQRQAAEEVARWAEGKELASPVN